MFKKNKLSSAILTVITSMPVAHFAMAQEDGESDEYIETQVVTGLRASVKQAMDIKRESSGVVDAISAEDIGKFPDTNLAESLQRITGISIDRNNGEGSLVTARGFGPDFNMVTLNGRAMPAARVTFTDNPVSRSFEFANLASEGVSALEVYKTGRADITPGGIGATINIVTAKPLSSGQTGLSASVGAKILNDTSHREGDDFTPELSGFVSFVDDSDTFGVSLSASYQERDSATVGADINNWSYDRWPDNNIAIGPGTSVTNAPANDDVTTAPRNLGYFVSDVERTRLNSQLTLQYRPTEKILATVDYTMADNEVHESRATQGLWWNRSSTAVQYDDATVKIPALYLEDNISPKDLAWGNRNGWLKNELDSFGLNLAFEVNDNFTVVFDAHDSTAEASPDSKYGSAVSVGIGANVTGGQAFDFRGDVPKGQIVTFNDDAGNSNNVLDNADIGTNYLQNWINRQKTDITQIRLDGIFEFDEGKFSFGIENRDTQSKNLNIYDEDRLGDWGISNPGELEPGFLDPINFSGEIDGAVPVIFDEDLDYVQSVGYRPDTIAIANWAVDAYDNGETSVGVGGIIKSQFNRTVEEDIDALYAQLEFDSEFAGFPTSTRIGLRYEDTDVYSAAIFAVPQGVRWEDNNDFTLNNVDKNNQPILQNFAVSAGYDHILPNIDFSIDLTEEIKLRTSYSKTIARATYNQLSAETAPSQPSGQTRIQGQPTASSGNPSLVPLESDNLDLSVEWYYDDASFVSVGLFEKRVDNFIGTDVINEPLFGLRDPTEGPRAQRARNTPGADTDGNGSLDDTELFVQVAIFKDPTQAGRSPVAIGSAVDIEALPEDPLLIYRNQKPVNNQEAQIYGMEVAGQHWFGETGFGVLANLTLVGGDIKYDVTSDPDDLQFPLVGAGDTANLVLMYENYGFQARVAYNWRDDFLSSDNRGGSNPEFTESYGQLDASVSYDVTEDLVVTFEAINLNEEDVRKYARSDRALWDYTQQEARYALGARYKF